MANYYSFYDSGSSSILAAKIESVEKDCSVKLVHPPKKNNYLGPYLYRDEREL